MTTSREYHLHSTSPQSALRRSFFSQFPLPTHASHFTETTRKGNECGTSTLRGRTAKSLVSNPPRDYMLMVTALGAAWKCGICGICVTFHSVSLTDLFVGQLKSSLTCNECGFCSTVFDPFWDLSLPISKVCTIHISDSAELFFFYQRYIIRFGIRMQDTFESNILCDFCVLNRKARVR